jgi:hypothetical protein
MKRRLLLLNLFLLAMCALCVWRLRVGWQEARVRESAVLGRAPATPKPAALPASPPPQGVTPATFLQVAENLLFSKDRNPTVIIDVVPPKVMPPLPVLYGVLLFTNPPTAILSPKPDAPNRGYRPGDTIGDFKLLAVNNRLIEFEWDGKKVVRTLDEIRAKGAAPAAVAEMPAPVAQEQKASTLIATPAAATASGPGLDIGGGIRACTPGDAAAPGTVSGGYRKVVSETPFGKVCRWEQVK